MEESLSQIFFIESKLYVTSDLGTTNQNSVEFTKTNVPKACINETWTFNAAAFDADGDSLGYELVPCQGMGGLDISSWSLPDQIPGFTYNGDMYLYNDGTIFWEIPLISGRYNLALKVSEYRQGVEMGYVIKDFTVSVGPCAQAPIEFSESVQDISVYPWTEIEFDLLIDDLDSGPYIEAFSGLFTEIYNTASFDVAYDSGDLLGTFNWTPNMGNVRDQPYLVVFNSLADGVGEATEVVQITVLDPGENSIRPLESSIISAFPNPTSNSVMLEVEKATNQEYTIMNSIGETVLSGRVTAKRIAIDVSSLSANVYYLRVDHSVIKLTKID